MPLHYNTKRPSVQESISIAAFLSQSLSNPTTTQDGAVFHTALFFGPGALFVGGRGFAPDVTPTNGT
jgi:hypothetical protein